MYKFTAKRDLKNNGFYHSVNQEIKRLMDDGYTTTGNIYVFGAWVDINNEPYYSWVIEDLRTRGFKVYTFVNDFSWYIRVKW